MIEEIFTKRVMNYLLLSSNKNDTVNDVGTKLIGHAPHIAPKAYRHVIYEALTGKDIEELVIRFGRPIPDSLKSLLGFANGMMISFGAIRVFGYVPIKRKAEARIHNYPSDILMPNVSARLKCLKPGAIVIGWYKSDGTYVSIDEDGTAIRFDAHGNGTPLQKWPDMETWLEAEIESLCQE